MSEVSRWQRAIILSVSAMKIESDRDVVESSFICFSSSCSPIFLLPVPRVFIRRCFYIGNENISRWICEEWTNASSLAVFRDLGDPIEINLQHRPDGHGSFSLPPEDLTRFVKVVTAILTRFGLGLTYQRRLRRTRENRDKGSLILEEEGGKNVCLTIIFKPRY